MAVTHEDVISANRYLSLAEMKINAEYIKDMFLSAGGWTLQSICAMLGNMQSESTINPGIYESLDRTSSTNGFGLVQWTPNTKYKNWADENGYANFYGDIDGQILRIMYEMENGLQWIPTEQYPLSFRQFMISTDDTGILAQAFLYNYERPASLNQPNRSTQAHYWFNYFGGQPEPKKKKRLPFYMLYYTSKRKV